MKALRVVRDLGVRASLVALVVVAAGSASRWQQRRAIAANHREAGWQ